VSAAPPPLGDAPAPSLRADDFLAPVLFTFIAAVQREAQRMGATGGAADPEAVHDFRVALRRLRTALRPARRLHGKRHLRAVEEELGRFARATGALRDEEVLRETLGALDLPPPARAALDAWLVQRLRQERARRRRAGALIAGADRHPGVGPPLGTALAALERRLGRRRSEEHPARALAESALAEATAAVAARLHARPTDAAAMHALRIRYKRLRYTAELFKPLLGEATSLLAREAARMQKRLGELHDLDEALTRVTRARALPRGARAAARRALLRLRARQSARLRRDLVTERARLAAPISSAC
jgi:CHAD domain-containing protein